MAEMTETEVECYLAELFAGEPVVIRDEVDALLDPDSAPRGQCWFAAVDALAKRRHDASPSAFVATAPLPQAALTADAEATLSSICRDLPGLRVVLMPEREFIAAVCNLNHPLRAKVQALLGENSGGQEQAARDLAAAFALGIHGAEPHVAHHPSEDLSDRPVSDRLWYSVHLSPGRPDPEPARQDEAVPAATPWLVARPGRDLEALVAFVNDHEIAHAASHALSGVDRRPARRDGLTERPTLDNDAYAEENVADGVAILRAIQRFGPKRAARLAEEVCGLRNEGLVLSGDTDHWTVPTLRRASEDGQALAASGQLEAMPFLDLVKQVREGVYNTTPTHRWPLLNRDARDALFTAADDFSHGRPVNLDATTTENWNTALRGYVEHRGVATPTHRAPSGDFVDRAAPLLGDLSAATLALAISVSGWAHEATTHAERAITKACVALRGLITLDARMRTKDPEEKLTARSAAKTLKALELATLTAGKKEGDAGTARMLAVAAAELPQIVHSLPPRLRGLTATIDDFALRAEQARERIDHRLACGLGRFPPQAKAPAQRMF